MTDLNNHLERFWKVEKFDSDANELTDHELSEQHYVQNTTRDSSGRYIVRLPFKNKNANISNSYFQAIRQFNSLENRFKNNPELKKNTKRLLTII